MPESEIGGQRDQIVEETRSASVDAGPTALAEGREGQGGAEVHRPDSYVIIHNVAKKHNIGTLLRSCTAFGVKQIVLVGRKEYNAFGSHGTVDFVNLKHCYSLKEAKEYLEVRTGNPCATSHGMLHAACCMLHAACCMLHVA